MGIRSTNGVNDHLRALERKGYLTREDMKSRALRPRDLEPASRLEPTVPEGAAAPANDQGEDMVEIRSSAGSPPACRSSPRSMFSTPCASSATSCAAAARSSASG